ncbi:hypothetical protein, partial [Dialister hominis]|uniref:hypothetical protein n=3 Tax=Dialister TaxID=39948 RepID=UPI0032C14D9E
KKFYKKFKKYQKIKIGACSCVAGLLLTEQGQRHSSPLGQVKTFRYGTYRYYHYQKSTLRNDERSEFHIFVSTANTCLPRRGRCRPQILMPADRVDYQQPKAGLLVFFERSEV